MQNIKRDIYLQKLKDREQNGLVKIVTGIRRCGKSFLLNTLFYGYLKEKGVKDDHIIKISLDDDENSDLLLPKALSRYIKNLIVDDELYYVLLDEIQLADNFVGVLNGLLKLPNVTAYIVAGIIIGPFCLNAVPQSVIDGSSFISDVALAFIAFSAGEFFRLSSFKGKGKQLIIITLLEGYMYVDSDSVFVNFNLNSDGSYNFSITGKATHTKKVGFYNKTQY